MKWFKRILGLLVLLFVVVIVIAIFFLGHVVKTTVESVGPQVLGVDVKLADAKVFPLRGKASLKGLVIGNPKGYNTPSMFELSEVSVKLNVRSLFSDRIIIERILIDSPKITYEGSVKGSNISALLEQLESGEAATEPEEPSAPEEEEKPAGEEPALEISEFTLENAQVNLSMSMLGGKSVPVPLPPVRLQDLGKEKRTSASDVIREIVAAIGKAVMGAVKSSGALLGKGLTKVGEAGADGLGNIADGVKSSTAGATENIEGAVGGARENADEAVKKVGEAVGAGVENIRQGLGGLFKKTEDK